MIPVTTDDERFMAMALREARRAARLGEVPVGAVLVGPSPDGATVVLARGHNLREVRQDPTAHAEMLAIRRASRRLGAWRLTGTTLYVTLEPCPMCAGALVLARVTRLVYGCRDPRAGAVGSLYDIVRDRRLNHRLSVTEGVLGDEASALLTGFFRARRRGGGVDGG
ncbi:MAG TPA: tRNA adenosine(34) deaminase TadA [Thermodesulfobacteriota bacterium]